MTDIQARGASLSWVAPSRTEGDDEPKEGEEGPAEPSFTYEVSVSYSGKDGKYKSAYRWDHAPCHTVEEVWAGCGEGVVAVEELAVVFCGLLWVF